jgi:hypothetical protein
MKTNTTQFPAVGARSRQLLSEVRDELRERRQARSERRALERDLATYNTRADVDDILALISGQSGPEAEQVREIVTRNLAS